MTTCNTNASITSDDTRNYHCDDCGVLVGANTSAVWSDVLTICDLCTGSKADKAAALQREIDAMVEELRGLNDPLVPCQFCRGTGFIAHFKHVANGVCFNCDGSGMERSAPLPEDMARCMGCDHAFASGLIWGAEDAEVCPYCWEQVHGYPRWEDPGHYGFHEHPVCNMVEPMSVVRDHCSICEDIAGRKGEDW
jgi:hypothetical protein